MFIKVIRAFFIIAGSFVSGFCFSVLISAVMAYLLWLSGHSLEDPHIKDICQMVALHFGIAIGMLFTSLQFWGD